MTFIVGRQNVYLYKIQVRELERDITYFFWVYGCNGVCDGKVFFLYLALTASRFFHSVYSFPKPNVEVFFEAKINNGMYWIGGIHLIEKFVINLEVTVCGGWEMVLAW